MAIIQEDSKGLFSYVSGWKVRPTQPSTLTVGECVTGRHFRGTSKVGMSKKDGRGNYVEYWRTTDETI